MTDSFSTWLREERERQNISIAAISASTKIKASLFEGLERGDISQWPAGIFRRSFIRAYAVAIRLDPDMVCRRFAEQFPDGSEAIRQASAGAVKVPPPPAVAVPEETGSQSGFRLTLAETTGPFFAGEVLMGRDRRLMAIGWDAASLLAIAVSAYVVLGVFWMPLAVATMAYYLGGILLLGNSPGVCLFAPNPTVAGAARASQTVENPEPVEPLPFEPAMHPLDVVSPDQLITSPGQRLHPFPALHERVELHRPGAHAQ